jgi:hypothetical protein
MVMKLGLSRKGKNTGLRVFENRVIWKIFGSEVDQVTEEWQKMDNEELYIFYSSPNIIRIIKSRKMRWAEYVARIGEIRTVYKMFFQSIYIKTSDEYKITKIVILKVFMLTGLYISTCLCEY